MGVMVTRQGPSGRTIRYILGGPDDPDQAKEPDRFLLEAMREVDAMLPHTTPIAPQPSPTYRREEWLKGLGVPEAHALDCACGQHGAIRNQAGPWPEPPPLPRPDVDIFEKIVKW